MNSLKNKKVLITGGASGIGRIMGRIVLGKGAELIIWDINLENLNNTVNELSKIGKTSGYQVDISKLEEIKSTAEETKTIHGKIDILINNAGIIVGKYFTEHTYRDIQTTMDINTLAPMYITNEFLPGMIEANSGHICNIASSAGFISNPKMSVYAASKWAMIGWSDSLRLEMKQQKKNIGVTTVTPYYISTGMFDGVKSLVPILNPEKVAKKIIKAIESNRIILSMPWSMRFVRFFQGIFPIWLFDWFVGKILGVYHTMDQFTGRKEK
ncbi:SDR family oxidoreductase [Belliella sp. DSM 107340]|uniref:SDR family oxidoreductase n=1 Tax=Belliella calami TaxID=2923436 RepID=A0ABS9UIT7_9BACT|nr:SDR family oxidoreductase [Belliella calami]MCH7396528.1 SDR family oxidoreductase [Belliella calami]